MLYGEAARLAHACGAIEALTYFYPVPHQESPCHTHFFNREGRGVGYFSHDLESYNDTRELCQDNGGGRIWCSTHKERLRRVSHFNEGYFTEKGRD